MLINLSTRTKIRELGSGGFGTTTLYEDDQRHRFVIKTFCPKGSNDSPKALAMFKAECDRLREVGSHQQIPSYLGFEESEGQYSIAQQFIPGRSLRQILDEEGTFSPTQALKLLEQILDPPDNLHRNRIIPRDIKPDNIIISLESNLPVIVDFGAAKLVSETVLAQTGTVIGTANYAAPEQLAGQTCFQSDIYSLGLTIIELLTGIQPFEQIDMHTGESIWFASSNGVSERFAAILDKMTARFLRDRYQSIQEIRDALYALKRFTDQQVKEREDRQERWRSRKWYFINAIAVTSLAVLAGTGVWQVTKEPVSEFVAEMKQKQDSTAENVSPEERMFLFLRILFNLGKFFGVAAVTFSIYQYLKTDPDHRGAPTTVLIPMAIATMFIFGEGFILGGMEEMMAQPEQIKVQ